MEYIDTNIFIRYLTQDNPQLSVIAYEIMRQLEEGSRTATTCEGVIVEVVQVLSSKRLYNVSRTDISFHLSNIISFKGLRLSNKQVYINALVFMQQMRRSTLLMRSKSPTCATRALPTSSVSTETSIG